MEGHWRDEIRRCKASEQQRALCIELDVDTLVIVETARGNQPAVCVTGTFRANYEDIVKHWGGGPVKRVLKVMREFALEWPNEPDGINVIDMEAKPFGDDE